MTGREKPYTLREEALGNEGEPGLNTGGGEGAKNQDRLRNRESKVKVLCV